MRIHKVTISSTFQRKNLPTSSELNSKPSSNPRRPKLCLEADSCWLSSNVWMTVNNVLHMMWKEVVVAYFEQLL
jgi:hypothetical protein